MMKYTFFANGEWYEVWACTYEAAVRKFREVWGGLLLESALLVQVVAA